MLQLSSELLVDVRSLALPTLHLVLFQSSLSLSEPLIFRNPVLVLHFESFFLTLLLLQPPIDLRLQILLLFLLIPLRLQCNRPSLSLFLLRNLLFQPIVSFVPLLLQPNPLCIRQVILLFQFPFDFPLVRQLSLLPLLLLTLELQFQPYHFRVFLLRAFLSFLLSLLLTQLCFSLLPCLNFKFLVLGLLRLDLFLLLPDFLEVHRHLVRDLMRPH